MITHLIKPDTIRKKTIINENVDEKYLATAIPIVEDFRLVPIIGIDKYDQLIADVAATTVSVADVELLKFIEPMLIHFVMEKVVVRLNNQVNAIGTTDDTNEGGSSLSPRDTYRTGHEYKSDGEAYALRLVKFMCREGIDVFNAKTFTVPIYGGRRSNNKRKFIS